METGFKLIFVSILYLMVASVLGLAFVSMAWLVSLLNKKRLSASVNFLASYKASSIYFVSKIH